MVIRCKEGTIGARILIKTPYLFCLKQKISVSFFADHLPVSILDPFESISHKIVICTQSWGYKEANKPNRVKLYR